MLGGTVNVGMVARGLALAVASAALAATLGACGQQVAPQDSSAVEPAAGPAAEQDADAGADAAAQEALEEEALDAGARFSASQTYRGTAYVGDVRTNGGPKPVTVIPGAKQPPAEAELFLFADGCCYYVDPFYGNGTAPISLHKLDLATGDDAVLADDIYAGSNLFYADDSIVYQSFVDGQSGFKLLDVATGEATPLFEGETEGLASLVGVCDGIVYATYSLYDSPMMLLGAQVPGGADADARELPAGEYAVGVFGGMLVTSGDNVVYGRDLKDLSLAWQAPVAGSIYVGRAMADSAGMLYFPAPGDGPNGTGASRIAALDPATGDIAYYEPHVANLIQVMQVSDGVVYFCGTLDDDINTVMSGDFQTYALHLDSGTVTDLEDGTTIFRSDAGAGDAEAVDAPAQVETADFTVTVPEYWRGKVSWGIDTTKEGYALVTFYPAGLDDREDGAYVYRLVEVRGCDLSDPVVMGDIGGGMVASVEGSSYRVEVWQTNWTFMAYQYHQGEAFSTGRYTEDALRTLVDLATHGKLAYDDCTAEDSQIEAYNCNQAAFEDAIIVP